MWYQKTKRGFYRVFVDPEFKPNEKDKPLPVRAEVPPEKPPTPIPTKKPAQLKEASKYQVNARLVTYSEELKKARILLKKLGKALATQKEINKRQSEEIERLTAELKAAQSGKKLQHVADISLSSLINEVRSRTDNSHKLEIFKKIFEDNVEIREQIKTIQD